jgi:hypothetical protein
MSRRANILVLAALALGVAYGGFGISFLLPTISDDMEAMVEATEAPVPPEIDYIRSRMLSLKKGMTFEEAERVLGLVDKFTLEALTPFGWIVVGYEIDGMHVVLRLFLSFGDRGVTSGWLEGAELYQGARVVARFGSTVPPSPSLIHQSTH